MAIGIFIFIVIALIVGLVIFLASHRRGPDGEPNAPVNPRDIFVYLLGTVALYILALGGLMVVWALAEVWFPERYSQGGSGSGPLRFGISMIVVAFPLFLFLNHYIRKRIEGHQMDSGARFRLAFSHFNLFLVSVTAIVDLIATVNVFLGGDLTLRFVVKAVAVLVMIGLVYLYYRPDLDSDLVTAAPQAPGPRAAT
jgi:hypothetical protein